MISFLVFAASIMVLVGLHEAGHFFMARAFGVYVKEFAIGFGPKLFAIRGKETRYSLRLIPFGGYVKMAGEDRLEDDESIPHDRVLYSKPPYARALISLAGPSANLLLAFAITLFVIWSVAFPMLQVSEIVSESPAAEVLQFGDRILAMDGHRILTREQITSVVEASKGDPIAILLEREGTQLEFIIEPEYIEEESRFVLGAYFYIAALTNELSAVESTSPLAAYDVQPGDRIVAVNDEPTGTLVAIQIATDAALPDAEITLTLLRNGETLDVVLPAGGNTAYDLYDGTQFADLGVVYRRAGLGEGIVLASGQFVGYIRALAEVIRSVFAGQVAAGEVFQGPVGVAKILGEGIRVSGAYFFTLLAFLSLNFGLINLVPFPALDGSRAVFALYEWIRGKPIPPQREGIIHAIGFLILISLMVLITYRDIVRLFR
ncbi:RIP metalloprotease RseP [Candidatus Bipolaricaulota bacterium]|nr:RIP metalloprotease RseP [Candidatus Bipolaricaulota bacterium]